MKRTLRISALLLVIFVITWTAGCSDDVPLPDVDNTEQRAGVEEDFNAIHADVQQQQQEAAGLLDEAKSEVDGVGGGEMELLDLEELQE